MCVSVFVFVCLCVMVCKNLHEQHSAITHLLIVFVPVVILFVISLTLLVVRIQHEVGVAHPHHPLC